MQTKNDFRFIIPYVEFAKEVKGLKPCILDTSVVIDGRIADVVETHVFDGQLIMPKFVIGEFQAVADSSDRLRRGRGRRGLDMLNRLRGNHDIELVIYERDLPEFAGLSVDLKLVALAKHLQGKLITNDYNLNKVARLQGVTVINLNDLANALKPVFLPGERIEVRIVKVGEEPGQGIGYLEDGTMVVVESGRDRLNQTVPSPSPVCCKPAPAAWCSEKSRSRIRATPAAQGQRSSFSIAKNLGRGGMPPDVSFAALRMTSFSSRYSTKSGFESTADAPAEQGATVILDPRERRQRDYRRRPQCDDKPPQRLHSSLQRSVPSNIAAAAPSTRANTGSRCQIVASPRLRQTADSQSAISREWDRMATSVPLLGTSSAGSEICPRHCLFQAVAHVGKRHGSAASAISRSSSVAVKGSAHEHGWPIARRRSWRSPCAGH